MPSSNDTIESTELDLDISVVEDGALANTLMGDTDNGCDTQKAGDC